ncbi:DotU family type IV/VI secretion system protein [Gemmatimonadota bacterium DH-20]|uniref:DotU family type IV/VI secretion system protein n=1 Tax=Gaopeijia maritima TaxID=3119007 RepID=A0ABU9EB70_9BACT
MSSTTLVPSARGGLAQALQEAFTVTVRLRTGRQVATDADQFRTRMKSLLATADREARAAGYPSDEVKRAIYAFVAFLDESVLNSPQAMFEHWARQPLQEEIFGDHMAGETFFRHLRDLLGRPDSESVADTLEVYQLCLLLGFRGRFGGADRSELGGLVGEIDAKIRRSRGGATTLAPEWGLPAEALHAPRDPWIRTFAMVAIASAVVALALFALFSMLLSGSVGTLESLAAAG